MRCAHAHSYNLYCAQGLLQGSLKNKSVYRGIRGKSVKEELKGGRECVKERMGRLKDDEEALKGDENALKGDRYVLKSNLEALKGDYGALKGDGAR